MADAISQLEYTPIKHDQPLSVVFANRSEEDEIFPLTVKVIAEAQKAIGLCNNKRSTKVS